jgi:capsular exopolysaccharide synthesis family protein
VTRTAIQAEEGHLVDQLAVLRRRWRTALATFLGFLAVAGALSLRLPPVYQATARVVIGAGYGRGLLSDRINPMEGYLLEQRSFETQLEVIRSEPVARIAAERLGWVAPDAAPEQRELAAARVKSAISVQHLSDTRIVLIGARAAEPAAARELANAVAGAYIHYALEEGNAARSRSVAWLTEELETLREKLRGSEERLADYMTREDVAAAPAAAEAGDAASPAEQALRADLAAAEVALGELLGRYRERHPRVLEAQAQVASLRARIAEEQGLRAESRRALVQYRLLQRDADLDHQMYEVLLKKLKETDVAAGVGESDIRILEDAKLPSRPVAPRTARNLGVAAVLALCLALALAWMVEYFDRSVGSAEDVRRALGLPTLGVVSSFGREPSRGLLVAEVPGSAEGEMFRTLRTNVRFSHVDVPRRVVLVTSTGPAEGKSTILANLGVSLAQSGRRTLIVDTDLRRPVLHRIFALSKARGLADVLAGDVSLDEVLRPTRVADLEVLPCGTVPANPAELIESARLQELLARLRERYEYVLLDSPPAGGLVDASLLSALADGVLFVVEPRRFDWRVLRAALRQLDRAGARLYGVVINKAPRDADAGLYGYYGYRYGADARRDAAPDPAGAA